MNIARHRKMIQVDDIRNLLEARLKISYLVIHRAINEMRIAGSVMLPPS